MTEKNLDDYLDDDDFVDRIVRETEAKKFQVGDTVTGRPGKRPMNEVVTGMIWAIRETHNGTELCLDNGFWMQPKNATLVTSGGSVSNVAPNSDNIPVTISPAATATFVTLDSGTRQSFPSGMQRDTQSGKPRYDLIPLWFLRELAELMARGAEKYGDRNWEQANSPEEADRMDASGLRHHFQYLEGDTTENHLAATVFNLFAAETTRREIAAAEWTEIGFSDGDTLGTGTIYVAPAGDFS